MNELQAAIHAAIRRFDPKNAEAETLAVNLAEAGAYRLEAGKLTVDDAAAIALARRNWPAIVAGLAAEILHPRAERPPTPLELADRRLAAMGLGGLDAALSVAVTAEDSFAGAFDPANDEGRR